MRCIEELSIYQLSILVDRFGEKSLAFEAVTFIRGACSMERKRGENHRCESTGANFPCGAITVGPRTIM